MHDIVQSIQTFNAGRDPDRLAMKLAKMRTSPFVFLRGTCHRFYDRLPKDGLFDKAPGAWLCGDAHLENFGTYKGDNRLAYFDINDFDEGALAPVTWDLVRMLCSILLAGETVRATANDSIVLCHEFIDSYARTLASGKACWVERETAQGLIRDLLLEIEQRRRVDFLDKRSDCKGKKRAIKLDGKHALPVTLTQRGLVTHLVEEFARTQPDPAFFEVIDVARRIAGTGSLGIDRYAILVHGKGCPDGNYLLDLKRAMPSEIARHSALKQPSWTSEAHRVVAVQRRMQAVSMAFLNPLEWQHSSYILRALQPTEDRVSLADEGLALADIQRVIGSMGHVMASAHLRSSGRQGSAIADDLITFAEARTDWRDRLVDVAQSCADDVVSDWRAYSTAYDGGAFANGAATKTKAKARAE